MNKYNWYLCCDQELVQNKSIAMNYLLINITEE